MKNSEAVIHEIANSRAIANVRAYYARHEPDYLPEFERNIQEITARQVQFWRDRESEQCPTR